MSYERLKQRQRAERHTHNENLALRTHRSLSWLNRAEQAEDEWREERRREREEKARKEPSAS